MATNDTNLHYVDRHTIDLAFDTHTGYTAPAAHDLVEFSGDVEVRKITTPGTAKFAGRVKLVPVQSPGKVVVQTRFRSVIPVTIAEDDTPVGPIVIGADGLAYAYTGPSKATKTFGTPATNAFTVTAKQPGALGNVITVAVVVAGNNTALSVAVSGAAITVNSATNGSAAATSTVQQIVDAINASAAASALVVAAAVDASGTVGAASATALTGGASSSHDPAGIVGVLLEEGDEDDVKMAGIY